MSCNACHCLFRPLLALALAAAAACAADQDGADIPDIEQLPVLEAVEELRIGSVDDPEAGFSSIGGLTIDDEGRAYVIEQQARQIRVYDAAGQRLHTIGRAGRGPGEFSLPAALGLIGDTLWVSDIQLRRVTLFSRDGQLIETISSPSIMLEVGPGMPGQVVAMELRPDGTLGGSPFVPVRMDQEAVTLRLPYVRMSRSGELLDTVRVAERTMTVPRTVTLAGRPFAVPSPAPSTPLYVETLDHAFVVTREAAASAADAQFTITSISGMADTIFHEQLSYRPEPFPPGAVDTMLVRSARNMAQLAGSTEEAVLAAYREAVDVPAFQPPITAARAGEDMVLWLRRAENERPVHRWILIEPDGSPRGALELPRNLNFLWSRGDVLWADVKDEFDVPWLVRYRLRSR